MGAKCLAIHFEETGRGWIGYFIGVNRPCWWVQF